MSGNDLNFLPTWKMAELVRKREISPVELVQRHLDRIGKLNPKLNAYVQVDAEGALRQAQAAEAAVMGGKPGPLCGVPISIKSAIDVRGMLSESGTRLRAGRIADADAPLVARLKDAGAVVLGVTNTPELLMAWETDNLLYGRTNNPWDPRRTAGGSSGGEAAAIASGCSAGGVGSDGGGSIRVPAHFCGICGLKPTPGRIPATGHFPPSVGPFALLGVVGPMARTVRDLELLVEVIEGPELGDPSFAPVPLRRPSQDAARKIPIAYFEDDGRTPVTRETRKAVERASKGLEGAGFKVEPFRPQGLEKARQLWWRFFGVAGGILLRRMLCGHDSEISPILKEFNGWVAQEAPHTSETMLDAWIGRDRVRIEVFEQMERFPVLVCPVASVPAFGHGERRWQVDGHWVDYLDAWSYCQWFNLLGMPAATVPVSDSAEGLPIGVQIVARPWEDGLVLEVAKIIEEACGGLGLPTGIS